MHIAAVLTSIRCSDARCNAATSLHILNIPNAHFAPRHRDTIGKPHKKPFFTLSLTRSLAHCLSTLAPLHPAVSTTTSHIQPHPAEHQVSHVKPDCNVVEPLPPSLPSTTRMQLLYPVFCKTTTSNMEDEKNACIAMFCTPPQPGEP